MLGLPDSHSGVVTQDEWLKLVDVRDAEQIRQWAGTQASLLAPRLQEFRTRRPDGEIRWLRVSARILPGKNGRSTRLVGLLFDDTDPRRAEETVRESEERLRQIQEAALIGTFVTDADHKTFGSEQFYRNLGLPEDMAFLDSETYIDFIHPDDRERVVWETLAAIQSADGLDIEYRINRPDTGEIRWVFLRNKYERTDDGQLIRIVGAHIDITESKLTKAALHESEDRLYLIQEAALIGTFVIDADLRAVGSRQFYRNLGLPEDTVSIDHETHTNLTHPHDRERVQKETAIGMQSADGFDCEYRIIRADTGELRWIFARIKFERTSDDQLIRIIGAHLDITEHKRAKAALHESEGNLSLIQEAALIGTFTIDENQIMTGSKQFYRNLGLPDDSQSLHVEKLLDIIHPDDRKRVEQLAENTTSSTDGQEIEYRIRCADTGELRWIFSRLKFERADDGQQMRIVGAHLDITDVKRAEVALYESVSLNQSIIDSSADCVKLIDLDGRLLFINKQGLAALEIEDGSRLLGNNWADLLPRSERPKAEAAIRSARNGQTGHFNAGCTTTTGKPKWWDVVVTPICDEQGQPRQFLAISRDITEHRENLSKIRWTASHDMLTELPNRRYFQEQLEKVIAHAAEQ